MTRAEGKRLIKQLLSLVLAVSLVVGIQPTTAKATEGSDAVTITNIELATGDDEGAYTFWDGFNENWYMAPGTEFKVTYSDSTTRNFYIKDALVKANANKNGIGVSGNSNWSSGEYTDYVTSPVIYEIAVAGQTSGSCDSYSGENRPFTIAYDDETGKVYANTEEQSFELYEPQYKDISEMRELTTSQKEAVEGSRYLRFYSVTGPIGTSYETCTQLSSGTNDEVDTVMMQYCVNGVLENYADDSYGSHAALIYKFTETNPTYIIGVKGYSDNYYLHTDVCTKEYIPLKSLSLISPQVVYPQFGACTTDYQAVWEDNTTSEVGNIFATGYDRLNNSLYVRFSHGSSDEENYLRVYNGLSLGDSVLTQFPSTVKCETVQKGNATNQQVYTEGMKVALQPNEAKVLYMNAEAGKYLYTGNHDDMPCTLYSLSDGEKIYRSFKKRPYELAAGEYGILISNPTDEVMNFRLTNISKASSVASLPLYKPGQQVSLKHHEAATYRFVADSTYSGDRINGNADFYMINATSTQCFYDPVALSGEYIMYLIGYGDSTIVYVQDDLVDANNVSGAAEKEEWLTGGTQTSTSGGSETAVKQPQPVLKKEPPAIIGTTKTLKKVVFKAISNTTAAVTKVKNAKKITSYTIPKTVNIAGVKMKITTIESNAFKNCKKLKKVTISSNVKVIKKNAFKGCKKLKTVVVSNAKKLTIKKAAFKGCKTITFKVKKSQMKSFKKKLKKAKIGCKYKVKKK